MKLVSLHGGHSSYGDGAGRLEEFAHAAVRQGMTVFGFSEHMPRTPKYRYPDERPETSSRDNFRRYLDDARQVQASFRGRVEILVGAELELIPGLEGFLEDFQDEFQLDYAVGSVHFVHDIGFDYSREFYNRAVEISGTAERFCLDYLETLERMLDRIDFQVLGHFDLFKIFQGEPAVLAETARSRIDRLMAKIAAKGLLLDVNARGLIKPCREIYPAAEILRIARQHNVDITLGDDSHAPAEVGRNLDLAVEHVRQAGYRWISFFRADGTRDRTAC
ncbi:MAG: histidinol-phosphatase [Acidobacteria bacterium]|nr:histidinol-phosphatase [Acidobacteriota bacterium]